MKLRDLFIGTLITFSMFFITSSLVFHATRAYTKQAHLGSPFSKQDSPLSAPVYQLSALDSHIKLVSYTPFPQLMNTPLVTELIIDTTGSVVAVNVIRPSTQSANLKEQLAIIKSWQFSIGTFQRKPVYYRVYWAG